MYGKLIRCYNNEVTKDTPIEMELNTSFFVFGRAPAVAIQRIITNKTNISDSIQETKLKNCYNNSDITYIDINLPFISLAHFALCINNIHNSSSNPSPEPEIDDDADSKLYIDQNPSLNLHQAVLVDLSTNGTYLDGKKLNKPNKHCKTKSNPNTNTNTNESNMSIEYVDGLGLGLEMQHDQIISIRFK